MDVLLLAGPPVAATADGWLPPGEWSVGLLVVAAGLAVMNDTCEELAWRAVPLAPEPHSCRPWGGDPVDRVRCTAWAALPAVGSPLPLMAWAVVLGVV